MKPAEKGSEYTADRLPDRVSLLHKGGLFPYATAGAETPSWIKTFVHRTLPVPTALDARFPTLFAIIIHEKTGKVNRKWK